MINFHLIVQIYSVLIWLTLGIFVLLRYTSDQKVMHKEQKKNFFIVSLGLILFQLLNPVRQIVYHWVVSNLNNGFTLWLTILGLINFLFRILYLGCLVYFFYQIEHFTAMTSKLKLWVIVLIIAVAELLLTGLSILLNALIIGFGAISINVVNIIVNIAYLGFGFYLTNYFISSKDPTLPHLIQRNYSFGFGLWLMGGSIIIILSNITLAINNWVTIFGDGPNIYLSIIVLVSTAITPLITAFGIGLIVSSSFHIRFDDKSTLNSITSETVNS